TAASKNKIASNVANAVNTAAVSHQVGLASGSAPNSSARALRANFHSHGPPTPAAPMPVSVQSTTSTTDVKRRIHRSEKILARREVVNASPPAGAVR